jgi:hypothetical protein
VAGQESKYTGSSVRVLDLAPVERSDGKPIKPDVDQ